MWCLIKDYFVKNFLQIYVCYSVTQLHVDGIGIVWRKRVSWDGVGMGTKSAGTWTESSGMGTDLARIDRILPVHVFTRDILEFSTELWYGPVLEKQAKVCQSLAVDCRHLNHLLSSMWQLSQRLHLGPEASPWEIINASMNPKGLSKGFSLGLEPMSCGHIWV